MPDGLAELRRRYPWPQTMPAVEPHLQGWFGPAHMRTLQPRLSAETRLVVELGSWLGKSTQFLLRNAPGATVVAVDHWLGSAEHHDDERWRRSLPTLYETFLVNCHEWRDRLVPMRTTTQRGMAEIAALGLVPDLVYVDAGHDTDDVLADLRTLRRLWPGTTIVADDWRWETVRAAGEQFAEEGRHVVRADDMVWTLESEPEGVRFCTLAIHDPYRVRAKELIADFEQRVPNARWLILTDSPSDFAEYPNVVARLHAPTGPMAIDYLRNPGINAGGGSAYHDKRFVLAAALEYDPTAVFLDADSRLISTPGVPWFGPGLAVGHSKPESVADHLAWCGPKRFPTFVDLARKLGGEHLLDTAMWCQESLVALTKDGNEDRFLELWGTAGEFMQSHGVYSGEGGVIGLAAAVVGWEVDYTTMNPMAVAVKHERGGPKKLLAQFQADSLPEGSWSPVQPLA